MATLRQQLEKSKRLSEKAITDELFKFIDSVGKKLVNYNVNQLHVDSLDINGKPIGFYSYATEVITNGRKKQGEPFDASETGDFLKSFYIEVKNDVVYFGSKDNKVKLILTSDYWLSDKLFGITEENLRQFIKSDVLPFVLKHQRQILEI